MSCARTNEEEEQETPRVSEPLDSQDHDTKVVYAVALFKGAQFRVGDGVYLPPDTFNFRYTSTRLSSRRVQTGTGSHSLPVSQREGG